MQKAISESYAEYMAGRSYVYNVARSLDLASYGNGLDADGKNRQALSLTLVYFSVFLRLRRIVLLIVDCCDGFWVP